MSRCDPGSHADWCCGPALESRMNHAVCGACVFCFCVKRLVRVGCRCVTWVMLEIGEPKAVRLETVRSGVVLQFVVHCLVEEQV